MSPLSPAVAERTELLTALWLHLGSVWDEGDEGVASIVRPPLSLFSDLNDRSLEEVLPEDLRERIWLAWGEVVLERTPMVRVSATHPLAQAFDVIGPVARVWSRAIEQSFSFCRGRFGGDSPLWIFGEVREQFEELERLGVAIDADALRRALESAIAQTEDIEEPWTEVVAGIAYQVTSGPPRKRGFVHLARAIGEQRRRWTDAHWRAFLRARWSVDAGAVQHAANMTRPTRRKTIETLGPVACRWFAGDLGRLGRELELPGPLVAEHPRAPRRVPLDTEALRVAVLDRLHGPEDDPAIGMAARRPSNRRREIAAMAAEVLQAWEARGRPPTVEENGAVAFRAAQGLGKGSDKSALYEYLKTVAEAATTLGYAQPVESTPPIRRSMGTATLIAPDEIISRAEQIVEAIASNFFSDMILIGARGPARNPAWQRKTFRARALEAALPIAHEAKSTGRPLDDTATRVAARHALAEAAAEYVRRSDVPLTAIRDAIGPDQFTELTRQHPDEDRVRAALDATAWLRMLEVPRRLQEPVEYAASLRRALAAHLRT